MPVDNLDLPSVIVSNLIQTLSWKDRKAKLIAEADEGVMGQVLIRVIPLIGADQIIEGYIED